MTKMLPISSYSVYYAACSAGFNEWRKNIFIRTEDPKISADLRFVDKPAKVASLEQANETGVSLLYLRAGEFSGFLEVLRTEKPLYLVLYGDSKRAIVQTGPEPPGEDEPPAAG